MKPHSAMTTPNPQHHSQSIFHKDRSSAYGNESPINPTSAQSHRSPKMTAAASPTPAIHSNQESPSFYDKNESPNSSTNTTNTTSPSPRSFPIPKLRLKIHDLAHPGATIFLTTTTVSTALATAVTSVQTHLYNDPSDPTTHSPPTRSVTLVLRPMPGVAYTTGVDLDPEHHKEIHFSLNYISGIKPPNRRVDEIAGVLVHEMVHCYQWNGRGSCPGGLVEGMADWVRLRCGLAPPHWKRGAAGGGGDPKKGKWDAGYQHTAYFLDYLEERFGKGTVRGINERLRGGKYVEGEFWPGLFKGCTVQGLWEGYCEKVKDDEAVVVNKEDISDEDVRLAGQTGAAEGKKEAEGEGEGKDKAEHENGKGEAAEGIVSR